MHKEIRSIMDYNVYIYMYNVMQFTDETFLDKAVTKESCNVKLIVYLVCMVDGT